MRYKIYENKNCFITGATGGIGRCISKLLAENGCNLFLTSTNINKLERLKEELCSLCGSDIRIVYKTGDLNKTQDIKELIALAREEYHSVDILVNCVGYYAVTSLINSSLSDFETFFNLNVRAAFIFSKEFSRDMIESEWGRIINIGSSSAYIGSKNTTLYCASKHALLGFTRALHDELKEYNIRAYCVSPSGAKTDMGKLIPGQNFDTFVDPRQIAEYVVFISSFDEEMISDEIRLNRMVIE